MMNRVACKMIDTQCMVVVITIIVAFSLKINWNEGKLTVFYCSVHVIFVK